MIYNIEFLNNNYYIQLLINDNYITISKPYNTFNEAEKVFNKLKDNNSILLCDIPF